MEEFKIPEIENEGPDNWQQEMEELCEPTSNIFKTVGVIDMKNIVRVEVHKGKDPSVELIVGTEEQDTNQYGENSQRSLTILFPGDMERQRFLEQVIDFKSPNYYDDVDSGQDEFQDMDRGDMEDQEAEDDKEESDEEVV